MYTTQLTQEHQRKIDYNNRTVNNINNKDTAGDEWEYERGVALSC